MRVSARGAAAAAVLALLAAGAGCARMEPAPGGPPDPAPPRLLAVYPDSMAVLPKFDGEVEFRFDEVVSEGAAASGSGAGGLEGLIIVSPSTRAPKVRWRRSRVTVAPAEGWQPNRVYRVQLLPGVTDLRQNRSDTGMVLTFTTGGAAPDARLTGTVIDWTTRQPAVEALVVAVLLPDSLPYRTVADSSGAFDLGPLPRGEYVVYGVIDQNRDRRQGLREAFDSVRLAAGSADAGELWAFAHDSAPPRITTATADDSLSATITFAQMLDPRHAIAPAAVRLRRLPDSVAVPVTSLLPPSIDDSLHRKPEPADTVRPDSVAVPKPRQPPPRQPAPGPREVAQRTSRPPLSDRLVLRVSEPWVPGGRYLLEIKGVRNVTGTVGDVQSLIAIPERKPALPDSLKPVTPPKRP
jgi:hypothetical protein